MRGCRCVWVGGCEGCGCVSVGGCGCGWVRVVGVGGSGWVWVGVGGCGWVWVGVAVGVGVGVDTESTTLPVMQKCIFKEHHALTTKKFSETLKVVASMCGFCKRKI